MTDSWIEDSPEGGPRLQFHTEAARPKEYAEQLERREQLRQAELAHLTELRDRVQKGIDKAEIDLASGTEMLLNISKTRMALAGIGYHPGAW
jgi:hypothetical protein